MSRRSSGRTANSVAPSLLRPAWSPNGKLVAFETHGGRTGTPKIAVMRANGSGRRLLTRGTAFDLDPAWSPDGTRIVFARVQPRSGADGQVISLYVIRPNGTGLRRLTEGAEDWTAAWSPDGRRIAFARVLDRDYGDGCEAVYSAINVMDADGSNVRRLSVGDRPQDSEPSWSPDGRRIAFSSRRDRNGTTSFEDCRYNGEIYVMGADGSDVRRLTQNTADDSGPDWSPDARRLVYSSGHSDAESGNAGPWLYVMPVDGGTRRRITKGTGWDTAPDWRASSVQP